MHGPCQMYFYKKIQGLGADAIRNGKASGGLGEDSDRCQCMGQEVAPLRCKAP